jgi:threonine synthase
MGPVDVACTNCRRPYPLEGTPFRCPVCGGLYDFSSLPEFDPAGVETHLPGIWRYRHALGLPDEIPVVSLGEGGTPLVWAEAHGRRTAFKLEYLNPSGSFKDRGSAPLLAFLLGRGVSAAIEDSSGNAGASFAAYAARAGIQARVFIPDAASGPKRRQIEAYGAEVVRILGPRSNAAEAARREADRGEPYASHATLPFNLPGYATLAYELVDQLGGAPGTVVLPAGQGGLLLGIARGFKALRQAGLISQAPRLVGVQARACAPLWAVSTYGAQGLAWVSEGETLAEGIRVRHPLRGDAVMNAVAESRGGFLAIDEQHILPGRDELARRGLYVEPTSAVVWPALAQLDHSFPDPLVAVLTGSGFKYAGN